MKKSDIKKLKDAGFDDKDIQGFKDEGFTSKEIAEVIELEKFDPVKIIKEAVNNKLKKITKKNMQEYHTKTLERFHDN